MWILDDLGVSGWLFVILVLLISYKWINKSPWRLPPGPLSLPIVGTLPFMMGDIREVFKKFARKYGNIFTVYIGMERVIVVNGYDEVKAILSNQIFLDRHTMFLDYFTDGEETGVLVTNGVTWKANRRHLLHILRDFGLGKRIMEPVIAGETQNLLVELNRCGAVCTNLAELLLKVTFNVICGVVSSRRYPYDDPTLTHIIKDFEVFVEAFAPGNPPMCFKFLRNLPGDVFKYHEGKACRKRIQAVVKEWVDDHKQEWTGQDEPSDVIEAYLSDTSHTPDDEHSTFTETQLIHIIFEVIGGGSDTTAGTVSWAFLYMILHPHIQAKVQAEIDGVTEVTGRAPTIDDRINMPYTEAVLSEVQRISDLAPLNPRAPSQDTTLHGYDVPKGTMMMINFTSVTQDPNIWPDPEQFDPSRFLDGDGHYQKRAEHFPFSMGKRACIGEGLARMELFIIFTHMLYEFTLSVDPAGSKPTVEGVMGSVRHPKKYDVRIQPRVAKSD